MQFFTGRCQGYSFSVKFTLGSVHKCTSTSFLLPRDKWSYHNLTLIPVYSYTRTELLSLRTKTSLLSLPTVDRLKDLNIGYHLPRRHRSSRGVKRKKKKFPSFIVASFNAQSVKGNDMACKRCEISTFIKIMELTSFCDRDMA